MDRPAQAARAIVDRLLRAVNDHDLDTLVACFAPQYVNETPAHPLRGFRGVEQVRANWSQIFGGIPDVRAEVPRVSVSGDALWTEWEIDGHRADGTPVGMRGVVIFVVADDTFVSARFYLEPLEETSGDVNAQTRRIVGSTSAPASGEAS